MIPVKDFKVLLGKAGDGLTEEEILQIRDMEYKIADVLIDNWLERKNTESQYTISPVQIIFERVKISEYIKVEKI